MSRQIIIQNNHTRIDKYIRQNIFKGIPQSLLEKFLRRGLIKLDGKLIKSNVKLYNGQILSIAHDTFFAIKKDHLKQQVKKYFLDNEILYQDQYIIALNKPSGLAVQGGNKVQVSINDSLDAFERIDNEIPRIIHRLDKDTSGVLLLARTLDTARFFAHAFSNHQIKKVYKAVIVGRLPEQDGKIDVPLAKSCVDKKEITSPDYKNGKQAITHFKVLQALSDKNISYIELRPITGRKHQIRAHMRYLGHPIYGDKKYGSTESGKLALHAASVELVLPNNKTLKIDAPLPCYISKLLQ